MPRWPNLPDGTAGEALRRLWSWVGGPVGRTPAGRGCQGARSQDRGGARSQSGRNAGRNCRPRRSSPGADHRSQWPERTLCAARRAKAGDPAPPQSHRERGRDRLFDRARLWRAVVRDRCRQWAEVRRSGQGRAKARNPDDLFQSGHCASRHTRAQPFAQRQRGGLGRYPGAEVRLAIDRQRPPVFRWCRGQGRPARRDRSALPRRHCRARQCRRQGDLRRTGA